MRAFLCLMLCGITLTTACTKTEILSTKATPEYDSALLVVESHPPRFRPTAVLLERAVEKEFNKRHLFKNIDEKRTGKEDLRIKVTIADASLDGSGASLADGEPAAKSELRTLLLVVDPKNPDKLDTINITGKSTGGKILTGTTYEAMQNAAAQIADYVAKRKKS